MKNILLLAHDDEGQEARLQAALDLVRALDGHLKCIDVVQLPALVGDCCNAQADAILLAQAREAEAENRERLEARLSREGVAWDWTNATGDIADRVTRAAEMADLIVLNRELDEAPVPDMHGITSRVVTKARKPVVAMPPTAERLNVLGRAMIAWDGKECAAETMRACVPLLKLASAVHIFAVGEGGAKVDIREAAAYLSRHGIHASVRVIDHGPATPDALIADEAAAWRADYIVMGAYGRGRLMETFGGVTKRLLKTAKVPLILGH